MAGGVHGRNRLGGNSLLDCVVYGRVCGAEVTKYLLSRMALSPIVSPVPTWVPFKLGDVITLHRLYEVARIRVVSGKIALAVRLLRI